MLFYSSSAIMAFIKKKKKPNKKTILLDRRSPIIFLVVIRKFNPVVLFTCYLQFYFLRIICIFIFIRRLAAKTWQTITFIWTFFSNSSIHGHQTYILACWSHRRFLPVGMLLIYSLQDCEFGTYQTCWLSQSAPTLSFCSVGIQEPLYSTFQSSLDSHCKIQG